MKGSIIERKSKDGKRSLFYVVVPTGRDAKGRKRQKWITCSSKRDAQAKRAEAVHQLNSGVFASPKGTLGDFIERWLREYAKPNLSPRTSEGYESIYRSGIGPALGPVALKDLKPDKIQEYYAARLASGSSTTTVRHHHMMLHRVLEQAVRWQILARNPADAATPPVVRYHEMHTFDEDGVTGFLDAARDTPYFALFHSSLFTGMRRSELLALRWQDVDLLGAEVSVSRSMHQLYSGEIVFRGTKTAKSSRKVALVPLSCDVLRRHLDNEMALCGRVGEPFKNDRLVFCEWDGRPLLPGTVSQAWRRLALKMGYEGIRMHDARHTHASLMLKQGIHPKVVQERLGHATINTTLDLYSHVAPGMQRQAAEAFGQMFESKIRRGLDLGVIDSKVKRQ